MKEKMLSEDEVLVRRCQDNDDEAFDALFHRHLDRVYALVCHHVGHPEEARDLAQEVFVRVYTHIRSFRGESAFTTWLYRIAMNESLMILRKASPDMVPVEEPDGEDDSLTNGLILTDWCCLPEAELLSSESRRFLDQAVRKLPETLRSVFILRDVEGLSIRDTAEALGISETAVKTRLLRARLKLREELSVYFGERLTEKPSE